LAESSFQPLADVVAKVRREERYHLMHMNIWLRRLADHEGEPRTRLENALTALAPDAATVFTPLSSQDALLDGGLMSASMADLAERWASEIGGVLQELKLPALPDGRPPADGRDHSNPSESFRWLWGEFTSVARLEEGVEW
jgi:ring-1,2-phenylacetyl-CoA epoxidase subunit PaaC